MGVAVPTQHRSELVAEGAETLGPDRSEDARPITEVVVRRLMADTRPPSDLSHRHGVGSVGADDRQGGIEDGAADIHGADASP